MDIPPLTTFLMWCTIINLALFTASAILCTLAADWVYRMQSKWFPISRTAFDTAVYSFFGVYKIVFIVFVLVPYLALLIMG